MVVVVEEKFLQGFVKPAQEEAGGREGRLGFGGMIYCAPALPSLLYRRGGAALAPPPSLWVGQNKGGGLPPQVKSLFSWDLILSTWYSHMGLGGLVCMAHVGLCDPSGPCWSSGIGGPPMVPPEPSRTSGTIPKIPELFR